MGIQTRCVVIIVVLLYDGGAVHGRAVHGRPSRGRSWNMDVLDAVLESGRHKKIAHWHIMRAYDSPRRLAWGHVAPVGELS